MRLLAFPLFGAGHGGFLLLAAFINFSGTGAAMASGWAQWMMRYITFEAGNE